MRAITPETSKGQTKGNYAGHSDGKTHHSPPGGKGEPALKLMDLLGFDALPERGGKIETKQVRHRNGRHSRDKLGMATRSDAPRKVNKIQSDGRIESKPPKKGRETRTNRHRKAIFRQKEKTPEQKKKGTNVLPKMVIKEGTPSHLQKTGTRPRILQLNKH